MEQKKSAVGLLTGFSTINICFFINEIAISFSLREFRYGYFIFVYSLAYFFLQFFKSFRAQPEQP